MMSVTQLACRSFQAERGFRKKGTGGSAPASSRLASDEQSLLLHIAKCAAGPCLAPGREGFLKEVWEWVDQYGHRIHDQLRRLGSSVDWSRSVFTMDDKLSVSAWGACVGHT